MPLRFKLLAWIVAINLGITGLLLWAILSGIQDQSQGYRKNADQFQKQREEIIQRLEDVLAFQERMASWELADITAGTILKWDEWQYYRDAMVLLNYTELDGEIVHIDTLLNPLGKKHRTFDDQQALEVLELALREDRLVLKEIAGDPERFYIAIPIHYRDELNQRLDPEESNKRPVWGGVLVQPRFPLFTEPVDYFNWQLFWLAMLGGTLVLIGVTYIILSKVVIRPVEEMALTADRVARGEFSLHCTPTRSRDEIGRLIASFNYMLDEVKDYHQHLEERVLEAQDRVRAAERHLVIAQRLAATGKLAAGIAHEINNPIGGMINAALNLKEKTDPDKREGVYVSLILEGLERIKEIVRKVLTFSPRSLKPAPVLFRDVLRDVETMVAYRIKSEGIRLSQTIEPEDLTVFCEPGELRQVILNLFINALDAVQPEEGKIEVSGRFNKEGNLVLIEIADNGSGMDGGELARAFDLFYSTKEVGKGTGLGLSLAHNIIESHGGVIEVNSEKGQGTQVRIQLPVR